MEPAGSLPCSQESSTGPYPEPNESSPYHPILSLYDPFEYYLRLGLPSGLFPSGFSTDTLNAFLFSCVLHALSIPFSLTWSF
jgi:hypothetical protein